MEANSPSFRTSQQRKALELYCKLLAESLNASGYDMRQVLKPEIDIPWTQESVKNHIWRPIMKTMYNIDHTPDMTTDMVDKIHDVINRHLSKYIEHVPFPSHETPESNN